MKTTIQFAILSAVMTGTLFADKPVTDKPVTVDCLKISASVRDEISVNQSMVLQIVDRSIRLNPTCACEIVKAAILTSKADVKLVASIVEVAAVAAPDQLRIVAQCAVAVAPDSLEAVQAVLAKLDPGTGDGVVASEKGGVDKQPVEEPPNVLDFPKDGNGNTVTFTPGARTGGSGSFEGFQPPHYGSAPATLNELRTR
jgi:hypothetical protein